MDWMKVTTDMDESEHECGWKWPYMQYCSLFHLSTCYLIDNGICVYVGSQHSYAPVIASCYHSDDNYNTTANWQRSYFVLSKLCSRCTFFPNCTSRWPPIYALYSSSPFPTLHTHTHAPALWIYLYRDLHYKNECTIPNTPSSVASWKLPQSNSILIAHL